MLFSFIHNFDQKTRFEVLVRGGTKLFVDVVVVVVVVVDVDVDVDVDVVVVVDVVVDVDVDVDGIFSSVWRKNRKNYFTLLPLLPSL